MVNASIVLYQHSLSDIADLVNTLKCSPEIGHIFLIDNSSQATAEFQQLGVTYIFNGKNMGYGAAHNIALRLSIATDTTYHLVVNPDIRFDAAILSRIVHFMDENSEIGQLMPKVFYPDGRIQYLCKLIPTPADLIFRRFLPEKWTVKQTAKFEMRNSGYNQITDVPYLSGCFMFLRVEALRESGIFDERFFMYPEDIDLTRRIHRSFRTVFYPEVSIVHYHERSSYKNMKMLLIHMLNLSRYFCKWGWLFDSERKIVNIKTQKQYEL